MKPMPAACRGRHPPSLGRALRRENDRPKLRRGMAHVAVSATIVLRAAQESPRPVPSYYGRPGLNQPVGAVFVGGHPI
jgi:hypothetical protein